VAIDLTALFNKLEVDPWRSQVGFSENIVDAQDALFAASDDSEAKLTIRDWIAHHQPCLFGRMAAKADLISFCILREEELCGDRVRLRDKIQDARSDWLALGHEGKKSGFVILAISPRLTVAIPDGTVQTIAQELCSSYLLKDIAPDEIYLDEMFLEKPGTKRTTWKWLAGVNYFCAEGDKRWWHDHRIPGGMAFSVNSVGHLVKSGQLSQALKLLDEGLGGPAESEVNEVITSLGRALDLAMRTISMAADAVSGKATMLLPMSQPVPPEMPSCPTALPKLLHGKDYTKYKGWYHTDVTVPSEYFRADVERSAEQKAKTLDFTYLFHDDIDNPDHITTSKGRRVRTDADVDANHRLLRMVAESVVIRDQLSLIRALARKKNQSPDAAG
jgi:hypothetical protein